MKDRIYVPANFAPPVAFEVDPEPPLPNPEEAKEQFVELRERLVSEALASTPVLNLKRFVQLAGDEAAALAVAAGFPLLTFPGLFNELVQKVRLHQKRQEEVRLRSELMLEEVA